MVVAGKGPDLIMLHGAGGNAREFTFDFLERFKDRFRVIIFDRPGLGYTDRVSDAYQRTFANSAESPAEQAALLHGAAQQLGVTNAIVMGHSFGGTVALAWALEFPDDVAGVVNLAGPSHPWPGGLSAFYTVNGSTLGGAVVPPLSRPLRQTNGSKRRLHLFLPRNRCPRAILTISVRRSPCAPTVFAPMHGK